MEKDQGNRRSPGRHNDLGAFPLEELLKGVDLLRVAPGDRVIDLGCGNGEFLAAALRTAGSAVGVDVSKNRLDQAALRFKGDSRVELIRSPLLDFEPGEKTFTKGFSRKALHTLTDPEKHRFFAKIGKSFTPKALFLVMDGILDLERADMDSNWPGLMKDCAAYYGAAWERRKDGVIFSLRKEYPAGIKTWTSALAAGGFRVVERERRSSFYGFLLAEKG